MSFSPPEGGPNSPGNSILTPEHSEPSAVVISPGHHNISLEHGTRITYNDKEIPTTSLMSTSTLWQMNDEEYTSWLVSEMCTVVFLFDAREFSVFLFVRLGDLWSVFSDFYLMFGRISVFYGHCSVIFLLCMYGGCDALFLKLFVL